MKTFFLGIKKTLNFFSPLSKIILVLALGTFAYFQAVVIPIDSGDNVKILGGGLKSGGNSIVKGEQYQNDNLNNSGVNTDDPSGRLYFAFAKIADPSPSFENYDYISGDLVITDQGILRIKPNAIDSEKIRWHAIEAEDIDTGSITSRTIRNHTIQGEDINPDTDIVLSEINAATITGDSGNFNTLTIDSQLTTYNLQLDNILDFGVNTITDGNFTGDWNWNGGDLTTTGTLNAGATTLSGNLNMQNNIIQNIGNAGTDFDASGGLTLAGNLNVNGTGTNYFTGSIFPSADISVDLGDPTHRFNNLYSANIITAAISTSGQAVFNYPSANTTFSESSVLINPTTAIADAPLLGIGVGGVERLRIDEDGDITTAGNFTGGTYNGNTFTTGTGTLTLSSHTLALSGSSDINQNLLTTSAPSFASLTLATGNLTLGANTLTTTNTNLVSNLNADYLDSQQGSYYLNTGTNFAGVINGTYGSLEIIDGTIINADLSSSIPLLSGQTLSYGLGTLTANALNTSLTYGIGISGNAANVTGTVTISNGGTGQTSAQTARNALLPSQAANANKFLQTDGTDTTWQNVLWSQLNAPTANLALAMQSYTTTFTYGNATTGNLFNITDTAANSGTGILVNITTGNASLLKPFQVSGSNGVFPAIAVDSTGKVGIGWATPTSQLTVIGGATFGATYATALLADGKVAIENNLGIGTTDPLAKLDINGDLRLRPLTTAPAVQEGKIYYDGNDKNYKMYNTQTAEYIDLVADPHIQPSECATGYVPVPGDARYGTAGGFCVMKYEAKCDDNADGIGNTTAQDATYKTWHNDTTACTGAGKAVVSSALGAPIAYISQITAKAYCAALGTGYHLITNNEWMTIARNIDRRGANWTSGTVGTGGIWRGHTDNVPANALEANTDDAQGYEGTGNVTPSIEKRIFTLSNGQVVWDLSGNVWEWNNDTIKRKDEPHSTTAPDNAWNWKELTTIDNYGTTSYASTRPSNPVWNATQNMGRLYTYNPSGDVDTTQYAFTRGGYWFNTSNAGLFTLNLSDAPTSTDYSIGFRCVFAP